MVWSERVETDSAEIQECVNMRTMDRDAIVSLKDAVIGFLSTISVEPEEDYAGSLELTVSLKGSAKSSCGEGRRWEREMDAGGVPVYVSVRLKGGEKGRGGALERLRPFAERVVEGGEWMGMLLRERLVDEREYEASDGVVVRGRMEGEVERVWRERNTLLRMLVSVAGEEGGKWIGRKFAAIHRSRELVVQFMYSVDARPEQDFAEALELFLSIDDVAQDDAPEVKARCREIAGQVRDRMSEIDGVLLRVVTGWRPERITNVDRTILRLMMLEGFIMKALPVKSAITEAISLARSFGTDNSPRFVNGVMHKAAEYFAGQAMIEDSGNEGEDVN